MHYKESSIQSLENSTSTSILKNTPAYQQSDVQGELLNVFRDTFTAVENKSAYTAIQYLKAHHIWNEYGVYGASKNNKRTLWAGQTWRRGVILNIDFGPYNMGSEHAFPHPGIVLADFQNMLVVIPMTGSKRKDGTIKRFPSSIESVVIRVDKMDQRLIGNTPTGTIQWRLSKDSVVLINQIRVISKNRIVDAVYRNINGNSTLLNIANTPLMTEIEEALCNLYGHGFYSEKLAEIKQINDDLSIVSAERDDLKQQLAAAQETIRSLEEIIHQSEQYRLEAAARKEYEE